MEEEELLTAALHLPVLAPPTPTCQPGTLFVFTTIGMVFITQSIQQTHNLHYVKCAAPHQRQYKETEAMRDAVNNTVARLNLVRSWKTAGCGGGSTVRVPPKGPAAQAWAPLGSRTGRRGL